MDQVSRPLLIALAATVALMAVWLVALRPKPVAVSDTPLAPTQAIPQARQAAATANAASAKVQAAGANAGQATAAAAAKAGAAPAPAAATQAAPAPAAQAAAAPAAATSSSAAAPNATAGKATAAKATAQGNAGAAKAPANDAKRSLAQRRDAALVRDVKHGKVVVLLFWNAQAADDVATRGALRTLDRHHGKVVVRVVPIANVAQYASVTKGVKIAQSPTTVVIGRKGHARVITGLSEPHELSQAVGDALAGR